MQVRFLHENFLNQTKLKRRLLTFTLQRELVTMLAGLQRRGKIEDNVMVCYFLQSGDGNETRENLHIWWN